MSCVRCHVSGFFGFIFGQSGEASRWRVCYQRGLPRLVFLALCLLWWKMIDLKSVIFQKEKGLIMMVRFNLVVLVL